MAVGIIPVMIAIFMVWDIFSPNSVCNFETLVSHIVMAASTSRISFTGLGPVTSVINRIALAMVFGLYFRYSFCHA